MPHFYALRTIRLSQITHALGTDNGAVKIGNLGLAVPMDLSRLTTEGMIGGTVNYMPPEGVIGGELTSRAGLAMINGKQ